MTLKNQIINKIRTQEKQAISFSQFMEMCLYDPKFGYYSSANDQFGKYGDFYTAPGLGKIFSKIFAKQFMQCFDKLDQNIIEIGSGNGFFARDILNQFESNKFDLKNYLIIEKSEELKKQQKVFLKNVLKSSVFKKIIWIEKIPENFEGIIFANELFDAIPTNIYQTIGSAIYEKMVAEEEGDFIWENALATNNFDFEMTLPKTNISFEYSPLYRNFFLDFSRTRKSIFFIVDYGIEEKQLFNEHRVDGSIRSFFKNKVSSNVLDQVGLKDITYHVNFTHLAFLTHEMNMNILGYTNQCHFLNNLEIDLISSGNIKKHYNQLSEINLLTNPSEMGELVKVMAIGNKININLLGFKNFDKTHNL